MHPRAPRAPEIEWFRPEIHHALILIHPGWSPEDVTVGYLRALAEALGEALRAGRPVFCNEGGIGHPGVAELLRSPAVRPLPDYGSSRLWVKARVIRRRAQREVDAIAEVAGQSPMQMRVAFGGMFAEACVFAYANS